MNENMRAQDEISLAELFKALLRKIKVLVLALLIGVIVGASLGVVQTINVKYYGTKIDFYVNPKKDSTTTTENNSQYGVYGAYGLPVMDNMVTLLNSELFAERLTLNKDGLPLDKNDKALANNGALKVAIQTAQDAKKAAQDAQDKVALVEKEVEKTQEELTKLNEELANLNTQKNNIQDKLTRAENSRKSYENKLILMWQSFPLDKETYGNELPVTDKNGVPISQEDRDDYKKAYDDYKAANQNCIDLGKDLEEKGDWATNKEIERDGKKQELLNKKESLAVEKEESLKLLAEAQEKTEEAVAKWREMPGYAAMVATNRECVSFSYYNEDERPEDLEDLARSFIYVKISVLNDKDLANELYQKVLEIMPIFVEENMAIPSGYSGTKCRRITRDDGVKQTNVGYTVSTAVKYGLITGAAFFVIACVAVILLDRSDKRLRNYEQTMSAFNVPVLGVIPTIEKDEEIDDTNDKKAGVQQ